MIAEQKATKALLKKELGINDKKTEELLLKMEQEDIVSASKGRGRRRVLVDEVPTALEPVGALVDA